jgi:hypothetical protein
MEKLKNITIIAMMPMARNTPGIRPDPEQNRAIDVPAERTVGQKPAGAGVGAAASGAASALATIA